MKPPIASRRSGPQQAEQAQQRAEAQRREAEAAEHKVQRILEVVDRAGRRDYAQNLDVEGDDVLGQLAAGLRQFLVTKHQAEQQADCAAETQRQQAEVLRRKVDQLLEVVSAAAQGDLTRKVQVQGNEPIDELAVGIGKMLADLGGHHRAGCRKRRSVHRRRPRNCRKFAKPCPRGLRHKVPASKR